MEEMPQYSSTLLAQKKVRTFYFERLIFGHLFLISDKCETKISGTLLKHR